jgi:TonB family protein
MLRSARTAWRITELHLNRALQRTAAPLGRRTFRIICQRLLQPTGRFRRRSLSLVVRRYAVMRTTISPVLAILMLFHVTGFAADVSKGKIFWSADQRTSIRITSPDQLELATDRSVQTCRYSRDGDTLRVVVASLGSVEVLYFRVTSEGLVAADGLVLYDDRHLEAATRLSRRETSAIYAPRPAYPYEARSRHITGHGVAVLTVDVQTGSVTEAVMEQSTGSPILDNAILSAFRRWRFKPGTTGARVRMPITYTMTGASYPMPAIERRSQ